MYLMKIQFRLRCLCLVVILLVSVGFVSDLFALSEWPFERQYSQCCPLNLIHFADVVEVYKAEESDVESKCEYSEHTNCEVNEKPGTSVVCEEHEEFDFWCLCKNKNIKQRD
jgi:hypothetical protein